MNFFTVLLLIIVAVAIYLVVIYNKFANLRAGIDAAWSDIDVQLKKRYNLIPALIESVKGYKDYEADTLKKVIEARNSATSATTIEEKAKANSMLSSALGKLFALAEAYPDLKANQNFMQLQDELSKMEETIANARRYYNAIVRDYNAALNSFPDQIVANRYNYQPREYFELDEDEKSQVKKMPKIEF
jgi:LemA protein